MGSGGPIPNPYAAPGAAPGPEPVADAPAAVAAARVAYAGFAPRLAARIIDHLFIVACSFLGGILGGIAIALAARTGAVPPGWEGKLDGITPLSFTLGLVGLTFYFALAEGFGGATLGKLIVGLRVRSETLAAPNLGQGLLQSLAYFIDGFFFGAIAYGSMSRSPRHQRVGDKWARTVVVRAASVPTDGARPGVAAGILLGCCAEVVIAVVNMFTRVM